MDIILIHGLWLDGSTWDAVVPHLEAAGHKPHALTLPGMESKDADRSGITLSDHVDAVVAAIDATEGQVLLVGHSIGCAVAHAAVDARPDRVARVVHVGGFPASDGDAMLTGLPEENGEVRMPDWAEQGEVANVADFDAETLARFYADAIPAPAQVLAGPLRLAGDVRRFEVPVTAVCPEYTSDEARGWLDEGYLSELAQVREVEYVDLPGGHWPQLTQPAALAEVILAAAEKSEVRAARASRTTQ